MVQYKDIKASQYKKICVRRSFKMKIVLVEMRYQIIYGSNF